MKMNSFVMQFAAGNKELFAGFQDYWNHAESLNGKKGRSFDASVSLDEKEAIINAALKKEVIRRSGVPYAADDNVSEWFSHPLIQHELYAVVGALVDMVLPDSLIDSIGAYTDMRQIGFGDSASFDIEPRDLFVVSKSGKGQKFSEVHKQFRGQVTIVPEFRQLTVGASLYAVLSGKASLASLVTKVIRSIETQVTLDAYNAFATAMAAVSATATTGLRVAGYSQASLIRLCEQVGAWNGGAKPIVMGTSLALLNVLPDDANYRYDLDSAYGKLGYVPTANGYDVMRLPQVADIATPFGRAISDGYLWIVSPQANKILKLVFEGQTLSFANQPFDNANLQMNSTMTKAYGVGVGTNATAAVITL
jgi:hypothetical protein